jgi:DNA processing protein
MTARLSADRRARIVLSVIGEPGDPRLLSLVAEIGAVEVLAALQQQGDHGELRDALKERLRSARPADVFAAAQSKGIRFVIPGDADRAVGARAAEPR